LQAALIQHAFTFERQLPHHEQTGTLLSSLATEQDAAEYFEAIRTKLGERLDADAPGPAAARKAGAKSSKKGGAKAARKAVRKVTKKASKKSAGKSSKKAAKKGGAKKR
jgi:hypothetical protein